MSDGTFPEAPPEETPDEGMGTAREEWDTKSGTDPNLDGDFGMSAGYPIINDQVIHQDPGNPLDEMETPPEGAMQGAPIFSEGAYKFPSPISETKNKPLSREETLPADQRSDESGT